MFETILPYALEIISTIVIAAIGIVGAWLGKRLSDKAELSSIATAIEQVVAASQITVGELQQTVVAGLKAANGGHLTDEDVENIKAQLLDKVYERVSKPAANVLAAASVDIRGLIQGAAEDMVRELKG